MFVNKLIFSNFSVFAFFELISYKETRIVRTWLANVFSSVIDGWSFKVRKHWRQWNHEAKHLKFKKAFSKRVRIFCIRTMKIVIHTESLEKWAARGKLDVHCPLAKPPRPRYSRRNLWFQPNGAVVTGRMHSNADIWNMTPLHCNLLRPECVYSYENSKKTWNTDFIIYCQNLTGLCSWI